MLAVHVCVSVCRDGGLHATLHSTRSFRRRTVRPWLSWYVGAVRVCACICVHVCGGRVSDTLHACTKEKKTRAAFCRRNRRRRRRRRRKKQRTTHVWCHRSPHCAVLLAPTLRFPVCTHLQPRTAQHHRIQQPFSWENSCPPPASHPLPAFHPPTRFNRSGTPIPDRTHCLSHVRILSLACSPRKNRSEIGRKTKQQTNKHKEAAAFLILLSLRPPLHWTQALARVIDSVGWLCVRVLIVHSPLGQVQQHTTRCFVSFIPV